MTELRPREPCARAATKRPDFWGMHGLVAAGDRAKHARMGPQHALGCIYTAFGLAAFGDPGDAAFLRLDPAACPYIPLATFDDVTSPDLATSAGCVEFRLYHRHDPGLPRCNTTSRATLLTVRALLYAELGSLEAMKAQLADLAATHTGALRAVLVRAVVGGSRRGHARYVDDVDDEDHARVRTDQIDLRPAVGLARMDAARFDGPVGPHLVELFGSIDARPVDEFRKRLPRIRAPTFNTGAASPLATPPTGESADADNVALCLLAETCPDLLAAYREMHRLEAALGTALDRVARLVADNVCLAVSTDSGTLAVTELSAAQSRAIGLEFVARTQLAPVPSPVDDGATDVYDADSGGSQSSGSEYSPSESSDEQSDEQSDASSDEDATESESESESSVVCTDGGEGSSDGACSV